MNGYVCTDWSQVHAAGGHRLLDAWYDRPYEYAWAMAHLNLIEVSRLPGVSKTTLHVLDVGPGAYQPFIDELVQRGHIVEAVDIDPAAVESIRARLGAAVNVSQADGAFAEVEGFDLVTCISTLEHDPHWPALLHNLGRARRLLLTFGVVAPALDTAGFKRLLGKTMFLAPEHVPEALAILAEVGAQPVGPVPVDIPEGVMAYGGGLLTFVVRTEAVR